MRGEFVVGTGTSILVTAAGTRAELGTKLALDVAVEGGAICFAASVAIVL